eukprot:CAMPEP_0201681120 /NCGR_PEP_ID=MMETSP0494-20130426/50948_1 /ASSEMBLY_ACC=CAM_ASM_000839 /TAXON_ID=420259 /ORGANISM="Thalassiosira gravida, Strain GMp14c1" /LENGTH=658 /DNA_ID=CAMNT_0048164855 /DNA_START=238 /DNA_END=2214 /DNA_ORIENTATION=+
MLRQGVTKRGESFTESSSPSPTNINSNTAHHAAVHSILQSRRAKSVTSKGRSSSNPLSLRRRSVASSSSPSPNSNGRDDNNNNASNVGSLATLSGFIGSLARSSSTPTALDADHLQNSARSGEDIPLNITNNNRTANDRRASPSPSPSGGRYAIPGRSVSPSLSGSRYSIPGRSISPSLSGRRYASKSPGRKSPLTLLAKSPKMSPAAVEAVNATAEDELYMPPNLNNDEEKEEGVNDFYAMNINAPPDFTNIEEGANNNEEEASSSQPTIYDDIEAEEEDCAPTSQPKEQFQPTDSKLPQQNNKDDVKKEADSSSSQPTVYDDNNADDGECLPTTYRPTDSKVLQQQNGKEDANTGDGIKADDDNRPSQEIEKENEINETRRQQVEQQLSAALSEKRKLQRGQSLSHKFLNRRRGRSRSQQPLIGRSLSPSRLRDENDTNENNNSARSRSRSQSISRYIPVKLNIIRKDSAGSSNRSTNSSNRSISNNNNPNPADDNPDNPLDDSTSSSILDGPNVGDLAKLLQDPLRQAAAQQSIIDNLKRSSSSTTSTKDPLLQTTSMGVVQQQQQSMIDDISHDSSSSKSLKSSGSGNANNHGNGGSVGDIGRESRRAFLSNPDNKGRDGCFRCLLILRVVNRFKSDLSVTLEGKAEGKYLYLL